MKIAIAGFGLEGRASYDYWNKVDNELVVVDQNPIHDLPQGAKNQIGEDAFRNLSGFDLVVRTAGLSPNKIRTDGKVWSATNEFFAKCPAPIIGVTGTKGKGTTCSLIASILRSAGKTVHLVGNIGVPALELLPKIQPDDVVVYELSSFQLWDLESSPQIAVVLMIEPDHLDVHADMDDYVDAKSNITTHQTSDDVVIYHPTNQYSKRIADKSLGHKLRYNEVGNGSVYVESNNFCVQGRIICDVNELRIAGAHNRENACAAITATLVFDDEITNEQIIDGLNNFNGLPHRLKLVAEKNGVKYYDDSIATTPGSAIAALKSFDQPITIILGGSDKGVSYNDVIQQAVDSRAIIIAIGQTGERIYDLAKTANLKAVRSKGSMDEVVRIASDITNVGGVVVLSPASASFDQYKSYSDRGDQFIKSVMNLL